MSERSTNIEWNVQCRLTGGYFEEIIVGYGHIGTIAVADVLAAKLAFEFDQPQPANRPRRRGTRETMSRCAALPAIKTFSALKQPGKVPMAARRLQGQQLLS